MTPPGFGGVFLYNKARFAVIKLGLNIPLTLLQIPDLRYAM
jgi:hypothetical protein